MSLCHVELAEPLTVHQYRLFCGSFMIFFCLVFAMSLYKSIYMCLGSGVVLDCIDS